MVTLFIAIRNSSLPENYTKTQGVLISIVFCGDGGDYYHFCFNSTDRIENIFLNGPSVHGDSLAGLAMCGHGGVGGQ